MEVEGLGCDYGHLGLYAMIQVTSFLSWGDGIPVRPGVNLMGDPQNYTYSIVCFDFLGVALGRNGNLA